MQLRIPALGINTTVEQVGLVQGALDVPVNVWDVAWYRLGPRPGDVGNAVIDGHKDSATGPAIFLWLKNLRIGDRVIVRDDRGGEHTFEVTEMDSYDLRHAPLVRIFGPSTARNLNLITCSGAWDYQKHIYDQRLVVYTRLIGTT
ncbi:MAG: hypothetical protein NVSMB65_06320 [Chloroflexota bacterium]